MTRANNGWIHGVVLAAALSGCGGGRAPLNTTVCDLSQYVQRTVSLPAAVGIGRDGQAVLSDPGCASVLIELRFTDVAVRTGMTDRLTAALKASGGMPLTVQLSGVYTTAGGSAFTAESLSGLPPAR